MLANMERDIMLYMLIFAVVGAVLVVLGGTIWGLVTARKSKFSTRKRMIWISVLAIFIAAISWLFNIGWIRFIMTLLLIPFIHAVIFFLTNFFITPFIDKFPKLKSLNLLFCITYLLPYIFLPDGADHGELYFCFGLIHSDLLAGVAQGVAGLTFLGHVVLFVLQVVHVVKAQERPGDASGS